MEVLVSQLEREAHQLEQDGDDIRSIRMMERALAQRIAARMSGSIAAAERLVIKYNTVAVRCFKNDDFEASQTLLSSSLELTAPSSVIFLESEAMRVKLRGTTFNNFGCLERRRGNMAAAASYLKQSIEHAGQDSPASFLNLSAVLTQLGRYVDAVAWCRRAITMMEVQNTTNNGDTATDSPGLMAIAYHNLASPLEQLDRAAAIAAYRKALEIARSEIGANSSTTKSIQTSLDRFLRMAPQQVTAGGPAPPSAAGGGADGGGLNEVRATGSLPAPSNFLPPVGGATSAAPVVSKAQALAAANTPRARAQALAAMRRKPTSYSPNSRRLGTPSGSSRGSSAAAHMHPTRVHRVSPMTQRRSPSEREAARSAQESATANARTRMREERRLAAEHRRMEKQEEAKIAAQQRERGRKPSQTPQPRRRGGGDNDDDGGERSRRGLSHSARAGGGDNQPQGLRPVAPPGGRPQRPPRGGASAAAAAGGAAAAADNNERRSSRRPSSKGSDTSSATGGRRGGRRGGGRDDDDDQDKPGTGTTATGSRRGDTRSSSGTTGRQFSRTPQGGSGDPVKDLEEEISKKDDIVSFMVARLAALLRAEEDFERCYIAVCRIQCMFRRVRARTKVHDLRCERNLSILYKHVREQTAARRIVRYFRDLVAHKQELVLAQLREEEIREMHNMLAGRIQRMARMWLAQRDLVRRRAEALLHSKALRCLQCWFRRLLAQRTAERLRLTLRRAQEEKISVERREFAAVQIQRVFLGRRDALKIYRMRRTLRMVREKEMESRRTGSAKRIQAAFRGFLGRVVARGRRRERDAIRAKKERWELVQSAVRALQAWTRGTLARIAAGPDLAAHRARQRELRQRVFHIAATKINSVVRGFLSRRRFARAARQRRADHKRDWGVYLLPQLQAFFRARSSAGRVAKKLEAQLTGAVGGMSQRYEARTALVVAHLQSRVQDVEAVEQTEWRQLLIEKARDEEQVDGILAAQAEAARVREHIASEREKMRLAEQLELATSGPVATDVKRQAVVSEEFKLHGMHSFQEIDEGTPRRGGEAEASVGGGGAASSSTINQHQQEGDEENEAEDESLAVQEAAINRKLRGPFYSAAGASSSSRYASSSMRGMSSAAREELRKLELQERTQKRIDDLAAEEAERKRVLADASGMRQQADVAMDRTRQVLSEPMPFKDDPEHPNQLEFAAERRQQQQREQAEQAAARQRDEEFNAQHKSALATAGSLSPESRRPNASYEDFSRLDAFTAAHKDRVEGAVKGRAASLVQAHLMARQSARIADAKAAAYLQRLPLLQQASATVAAFLETMAAVQILRRREQLTALTLQADLHATRTTGNAVRLIQSFASAAVSRRFIVRVEALSRMQERHYAAERIQGVARERQQRPRRRDQLHRERLRQGSVAGGRDVAADAGAQVRDFAARKIQGFLRDRTAVRSPAARGVSASRRAERSAAATQAGDAAARQVRLVAVRMIQRFFRNTLGRRRAGDRLRRPVIARRRALLVEPAYDGERLFATAMIQAAARLFVLRLRRRRALLVQRGVPAAARQVDDERDYAATRIQSLVRGRMARSRRAELERAKARKWAGLLDEDIDQQQPEEAAVPEIVTHDRVVGQTEDGELLIGRDKGAAGLDFAAAGDHGIGVAADDAAGGAAAAAEDEDAAAMKIQSAYRSRAAREEAARLREEKQSRLNRLAAEAANE